MGWEDPSLLTPYHMVIFETERWHMVGRLLKIFSFKEYIIHL